MVARVLFREGTGCVNVGRIDRLRCLLDVSDSERRHYLLPNALSRSAVLAAKSITVSGNSDRMASAWLTYASCIACNVATGTSMCVGGAEDLGVAGVLVEGALTWAGGEAGVVSVDGSTRAGELFATSAARSARAVSRGLAGLAPPGVNAGGLACRNVSCSTCHAIEL